MPLALILIALAAAVLASTAIIGDPTVAGGLLLVWPGLAMGLAILLGGRWALAGFDTLTAPLKGWRGRALAIVVAVTFVALLVVAGVVLDGFPNSGDEYAYVLQAQTYALGRLWAPAPPFPEFFALIRFVAKNGMWISSYQPGWSLLMAPAALAGLPLWLVDPLVGAGMVWAFFVLARDYLELRSAWIATLALVVSAFFLFNFGSFFGHGAAALAGVLFALCGTRYLREGGVRMALLAGAFLGYLGFIRAFNGAVFAAPFVVALVLTPQRRSGLLWFILGGAPFLAALLAYNWAVTGHPLLMVQQWINVQGEPVGLPSAASMGETLRRFIRLYLWTSPVFPLGWLAAFGWLAWRRRLDFVDWIFPATVIGFAFYAGSGSNQYGPRYYFEGWPFAVLTVARALEPLLVEGPRGRAAPWLAAATLAHFVFQLAFLPPRIELEHRVVSEREDIFHKVAAAGLRNAVVIVASSTGQYRRMLDADLVRNGLKVEDASVVYALDPTLTDPKLRALFRHRQFLVYRDGALTPAPAAAQ